MITKTVAGRTWHYSHAMGYHAVARGFTHPTAVVSAPGGILYVLNSGAAEGNEQGRRIDKLTIDEDYIGNLGVGDFTWAEGLALDQDGNVYGSDAYDHFVAAYDPDGERIGRWGEAGSGEGQFRGPSGLAFDSEDNLWVVDSLNDRVQKFTKDGQFLLGWGASGSDEGQLSRPWGITIDRNDDVYVADWKNDRVQKFSPDGSFLMRFGSLIDDGGQLHRPSDVAVDSDGDVYVTDWGNNRVQIYYPDGDIIAGLYGDARVFSKSAQEVMDVNPDYVKAIQRVDPTELVQLGRFVRPRGISIDEEDRIIIADCIRSRLQVYTKDKDYLAPQFNA